VAFRASIAACAVFFAAGGGRLVQRHFEGLQLRQVRADAGQHRGRRQAEHPGAGRRGAERHADRADSPGGGAGQRIRAGDSASAEPFADGLKKELSCSFFRAESSTLTLSSASRFFAAAFMSSSRRRTAASARTARAVTRSSATPVSRRALARIFDSAAVRSSLAPSFSMASPRIFAPRAASVALSPVFRKSPATCAAPPAQEVEGDGLAGHARSPAFLHYDSATGVVA